ncbi:hypothetical protein E2C01_017750 [Portunus trituberculatus]|uniref:Uncharacterized protein n=1 Tax=Portunus trituberculatus TaxID=210409 RepID=A0A5B7DUN3_PORTR|nr:hypothetical protein [Portunus trituberculatus]
MECSAGLSTVDSPEVTLEPDYHDFQPLTSQIPLLTLRPTQTGDAGVANRSVGYGPLASSQ